MFAVGTDIIEIERVADSARNEAFLRGVYTQNELNYYRSCGEAAQTLAGMFCAKEAVAKALGTGFAGFRPCDIEILHTDKREPYAVLAGGAAAAAGDCEIKISISHCKLYATATCILIKK